MCTTVTYRTNHYTNISELSELWPSLVIHGNYPDKIVDLLVDNSCLCPIDIVSTAENYNMETHLTGEHYVVEDKYSDGR